MTAPVAVRTGDARRDARIAAAARAAHLHVLDPDERRAAAVTVTGPSTADAASGDVLALTRTGRELPLEYGARAILPLSAPTALVVARLRAMMRAAAENAAAREEIGDVSPPSRTGPAALAVIGDGPESEALAALLSDANAPGAPPRIFASVPDLQTWSDAQRVDVAVIAAGRNAGDAVAALRADPTAREVGILVTGPQSAEEAARAFDMGADDATTHLAEGAELAGRVGALVSLRRLRDSWRRARSEELRIGAFDTLTELRSRRFADRFVAAAFERARLTGGGLAVLIFDIDRFKRVNDSFGHAAGDRVLAVVASRLRAQFRAADMVARYGGEEFLAVMPGAGDEAASVAAERVRRAVEEASITLPSGESVAVTVSAGAASASAGDRSAEQLIARADAALFEAKLSGRNRIALGRAAA